MILEGDLDTSGTQLIERVPLVAPVLDTLEVTVEAHADVSVPLAHNDTPAGARKGDGTGKAGQSRTDDGNWLTLFGWGADSALKRAHAHSHCART